MYIHVSCSKLEIWSRKRNTSCWWLGRASLSPQVNSSSKYAIAWIIDLAPNYRSWSRSTTNFYRLWAPVLPCPAKNILLPGPKPVHSNDRARLDGSPGHAWRRRWLLDRMDPPASPTAQPHLGWIWCWRYYYYLCIHFLPRRVQHYICTIIAEQEKIGRFRTLFFRSLKMKFIRLWEFL